MPNPLKDCPLATNCTLHCKKMNTVAYETVCKKVQGPISGAIIPMIAGKSKAHTGEKN